MCFWRQFYSELAVIVVKWSGAMLMFRLAPKLIFFSQVKQVAVVLIGVFVAGEAQEPAMVVRSQSYGRLVHFCLSTCLRAG